MVIRVSDLVGPTIDPESGQLFTVEECEPGIWQSVFPERLAHKSQLHSNQDDAWHYIAAVMRGEE